MHWYRTCIALPGLITGDPMKPTRFILALIGFAVLPLPANAAVFNIADGDYVALRQAAREAASNNEDDTIVLAPGGRYRPGGTLSLETVQGKLTIYGRGATIDGGIAEPDRLLSVGNGGELTVTDLNVFNVKYETNESSYRGGVLVNRGTTKLRNLTIANTTITAASGNVLGGAVANMGDLTLNNVTLSGNHIAGRGSGSGLHNAGSALLSNTTVAKNAADQGVGAGLDSGNAQVTTLENTIIADNMPADCSGTLSSSGGNLDTDDSCGLNHESDEPGAEAGLVSLGNNGGRISTHPLEADSPAMDAGIGARCTPMDARGVPRPESGNDSTGPACDMGAHENWRGPFEFTDAVTGSWFNPDQNGHGFMFEKLQDGRLLITWFVFDQEGNRDWIQADGEIRDGIALMTAYQVHDGKFPPNFDPETASLNYWGTMSVVFLECDLAVVAWHSDTKGYSSGGIPLGRLTSVAGTSCN